MSGTRPVIEIAFKVHRKIKRFLTRVWYIQCGVLELSIEIQVVRTKETYFKMSALYVGRHFEINFNLQLDAYNHVRRYS